MPQSWQELNISHEELEQVFEPSLIDNWAIALATGLMLRQVQSWQSIFKLESSCLFLSLIFNCPLILIIGRKLGLVNNNLQGLVIITAIALSLSSLCLILFNYYLWQKAKQLKLLSSLLIKVKQHNQLVHSLQILTDINNFRQHQSPSDGASVIEFKAVLNSTKNSLLKSIELENYLYSHHGSNNNIPHHPTQILADIEINLANTIPPTTERDLEYQQLFNEAIDLGISLHQEIQKSWTLR